MSSNDSCGSEIPTSETIVMAILECLVSFWVVHLTVLVSERRSTLLEPIRPKCISTVTIMVTLFFLV